MQVTSSLVKTASICLLIFAALLKQFGFYTFFCFLPMFWDKEAL